MAQQTGGTPCSLLLLVLRCAWGCLLSALAEVEAVAIKLQILVDNLQQYLLGQVQRPLLVDTPFSIYTTNT